MSHKTILLLSLLFAGSALSAQKFSLGVRAGWTLSNVTVREPDGFTVEGDFDYQLDELYRPLHSLHVGIDTRLRLSKRFSIVSGLQYARKGHKTKAYQAPIPPSPTFNYPLVYGSANASSSELHYLNLPVMADFQIWKGLALQGGVEVGKLLSARYKSGGLSADTKRFYEGFDFGLAAGLEYRFNDAFFVSARHIIAISSLQTIELTDDVGGVGGGVSSHNNATQLSVGYRHVFGK